MRKRPHNALLGCGLSLAVGCADAGGAPSSMDPAVAGGLSLEEPERGVQLATVGREIAPGEDEEWCEVVELPGDRDDEYFVARTEVAMTAFSHHLIISMAPEGSDSLVDQPLHEPMRCAGAHQLGADLTNLAASAKPYTEAVMPEGIGFKLRGGQRLVFDYHAFNSSEEPIRSQHLLNLHFVDDVEKPARTFGFYNQYFEVPPGEERAFAEECHFKDDVLVWTLTRHTHRLGKDFRVWWSGGERDGELIWTSRDWEQDIGYRFDEMCILFGLFAAVGDDSEVSPQSCILFAP